MDKFNKLMFRNNDIASKYYAKSAIYTQVSYVFEKIILNFRLYVTQN